MVLQIAAFVVPLGFDTLAVAIALGLRRMRPLRPALTFTFFEALMPLVGLVLGRAVGVRFQTLSVVIGGVVLLAVAAFMTKEAFEDDETASISFTSLRTAALAGLGISVDELAIGFPIGTSGLPVLETIGAIAIQAFVVTYAGILLGNRLGETLGQRMSRVSGLTAAATFAVLGVYLIAQRIWPRIPQL